MSGLTSPQSYPNDSGSDAENLPTSNASPLSEKDAYSQAFLHPIDESEDFYDPFSDLNLFLSKKIKKEIQENGSVKKWSGHIESNLLAKILPEFKKKFPRYRLGAAALKKVWEKVAYYYDKIQGQKGALEESGKLNLGFMIRENLKSSHSLPLNLPPYSFAHQIAVNLSECIATLEGRRPELNHLTKVIWAVHKHLLRDLSPLHAKSPYEEYDKVDKLIVKALLESTAKKEHLSPKELKREIIKTFHQFRRVKGFAQNNQLTSTLSILLANKLYPTSHISCHFALAEKKAIESFVRQQMALSKTNKLLSADTHRTELIQRLLALYSIAKDLPKDISEERLKEGIEYVYALVAQRPYDRCPVLDQSLLVFINAEMHLMNENKSFDTLEAIQETIIQAYREAIQLPVLSPLQYEHFEILIWKLIDEQDNLLVSLDDEMKEMFEAELGNILIDNPKQTFRQIICSALQFFKKVLELPLDSKEDPSFWTLLEDKAEIWSLQNDMICRWIHLDEHNPFFELLQKEWKSLSTPPNHETFIQTLYAKAHQMYSYLDPFGKQLKARLWILYKYFWYTRLSDPAASSYECFMNWHKVILQDVPLEKQQHLLQELSQKMLPLTPFETTVA